MVDCFIGQSLVRGDAVFCGEVELAHRKDIVGVGAVVVDVCPTVLVFDQRVQRFGVAECGLVADANHRIEVGVNRHAHVVVVGSSSALAFFISLLRTARQIVGISRVE